MLQLAVRQWSTIPLDFGLDSVWLCEESSDFGSRKVCILSSKIIKYYLVFRDVKKTCVYLSAAAVVLYGFDLTRVHWVEYSY